MFAPARVFGGIRYTKFLSSYKVPKLRNGHLTLNKYVNYKSQNHSRVIILVIFVNALKRKKHVQF